MSFADAVTVMCGFTPPSIGPNPARSYRRNNSQNPSARRSAGVRVSLTPSFSGVGADNTGVALLEVYDASTTSAVNVINASTRAFVGTGDHRVVVRFTPSAAAQVRERFWHETQEARELAERSGIEIRYYNIIYNLVEFVRNEVATRIPKEYIQESTGRAKILAIFSKNKDKQIIGGKVQEGTNLSDFPIPFF